MDGRYEEIELNEIAPGVFQGYSAALNLVLRAEGGYLGWHDPTTGEHIPTFQSEKARADDAESRTEAETARARRANAAEARAELPAPPGSSPGAGTASGTAPAAPGSI